MNNGDFLSADAEERQQLVQEFFFHIVGAIEVLAQYVNEARGLGLNFEDASIPRVRDKLSTSDPLRAALDALYANTRPGYPIPPDPYSDAGLMYRVWNYRHQVTHRRRQPFQLNVGLGILIAYGPGFRGRWREFRARRQPAPPPPPRSAHFILDPREPPDARVPSEAAIPDELKRMLDLVSRRCEDALALV